MFGLVISSLNKREEYLKDLFKTTPKNETTNALFWEIKEVLEEIELVKREIHKRFQKEHILTEKLNGLLSCSDINMVKIIEITNELHSRIESYNKYVEKINHLLEGKFSGILFKVFNIPKAGKIEV